MFKIMLTVMFVFTCAWLALAQENQPNNSLQTDVPGKGNQKNAANPAEKTISQVSPADSLRKVNTAQDDYHKLEVAGSYSHKFADGHLGDAYTGFNNGSTPSDTPGTHKREGLNGFDTSVTYNFTKYFGVKFDVSGHFGPSENNLFGGTFVRGSLTSPILPIIVFPGTIVPGRQSSYNYLGGIQLKNNSKETRFKPFAHFMLGASRQTNQLTEDFSLSTKVGLSLRND